MAKVGSYMSAGPKEAYGSLRLGLSQEAAPVPGDWFDGPRDERYGFLAEDGYGRIKPGA